METIQIQVSSELAHTAYPSSDWQVRLFKKSKRRRW